MTGRFQGGWIKLSSSPGHGTLLTMNLSFDSTEESDLLDREEEGPEQRVSLKNYKVLIVDDNPINLMIAEQFLLTWGMHIRISNNGLEAIKDYVDFEPDIILMDLQMPECDGYEATRRIRVLELNSKKAIPIIALSADVVSRSRQSAIEAGMNDIITKPFDPETLLSIMTLQLNQE